MEGIIPALESAHAVAWARGACRRTSTFPGQLLRAAATRTRDYVAKVLHLILHFKEFDMALPINKERSRRLRKKMRVANFASSASSTS